LSSRQTTHAGLFRVAPPPRSNGSRSQHARWNGTPFVLRAGKGLARQRKGVMLYFWPSEAPSDDESTQKDTSWLWIGIDGAHGHLAPSRRAYGRTTTRDGARDALRRSTTANLPAYGQVLANLLEGGSTISVRGDEAEEADSWIDGTVPMLEYPAGSSGPELP
jgi:glucose-6-phosphate 1-dehydrogenase